MPTDTHNLTTFAKLTRLLAAIRPRSAAHRKKHQSLRAHAEYPAPKADLAFKKVFGSHPDLPTSLLNAQLPLKSDQLTEGVEYMPTEFVPMDTLHKEHEGAGMSGRQFVVEMRMAWTSAFKQMVLFNISKVYVSQVGMGF